MKKHNWIGFAAAVAIALSASANAAVINLDLSSGVDSITNGATFALDTYTESGFQLRMVRPGDHIDRAFIGDLGFHNGPLNPDNITWTLTFGGNAFSLLGVDIAGFANGGSSVTVTGSNSASQSLSGIGFNAVSGLTGVTSVTFNIDQDGGIESVGLNGLRVDSAPASVPEAGASILFVAFGLVGMALSRKKLV